MKLDGTQKEKKNFYLIDTQVKKKKISPTEKQYKAKWNMKDLEKIQRPAIKKTSVWNGLAIHKQTGLGQSVSWGPLQLRWAMII